METRVFCVELKMGPSGHMDSTGIFPDSNTREFGPRRTTQRQPPRPTHKCNAPRLPFHVHLTHDLTRAASALPLHTAALAFVSFGVVLVQVQVQVQTEVPQYIHTPLPRTTPPGSKVKGMPEGLMDLAFGEYGPNGDA